MTPKEYEDYVESLISELDFWKDGQIFRNHYYPGVRQPGSYEVDIAIEIKKTDKIFLRFIVECKNWKRPVDRPVVQKLEQTRDAIGAHKAAIASPVGFTDEAIKVAKTLGISLWVIAENKPWHSRNAFPLRTRVGALRFAFFELRLQIYEAIGVKVHGKNSILICVDSIIEEDGGIVAGTQPGAYIRKITTGSAVPWWRYHPLFDSTSAIYSVFKALLEQAGADITESPIVQNLLQQ